MFVFVIFWLDFRIVLYWLNLELVLFKFFVGVCVVEIQFIWDFNFWCFVLIDLNFVDDFSRGIFFGEVNGCWKNGL